MSKIANASSLQVHLGAERLDVGLPVLAGDATEAIFPEATPAGRSSSFFLSRAGNWLLGYAQSRAGENGEVATERIYRELFSAVGEYTPVRIWNYVPSINEPDASGLENYRAFCRGRSHAFERHYGHGFKRNLSSASAVGTDAPVLSVIFAATQQPVRHFENPRQVAAYDYPAEHGPRPPSFARGSVVENAGRTDVFISGTASIRGHLSILGGGIEGQLACTVENLRTIGVACGVGDDLAANRGAARHFKIYLRHVRDQTVVAEILERTLLQPSDRVSYVRSDVCRAELDVEIEATLFGLEKIGS